MLSSVKAKGYRNSNVFPTNGRIARARKGSLCGNRCRSLHADQNYLAEGFKTLIVSNHVSTNFGQSLTGRTVWRKPYPWPPSA